MDIVCNFIAGDGTGWRKPVRRRNNQKESRGTLTAADVQALKDAIAAQQAALAQQQHRFRNCGIELHRKDQAVQQAQTAATDAAGKADAAQAAASQQQAAVTELKSDVTDLKADVANTVVDSAGNAEDVSTSRRPRFTSKESPLLRAASWRQNLCAARALWRSDINTPFNSLTMPGASQSNISEFFASGRQSRISMLAEGKLGIAKLSGYVEADFLSAGVTSNNNQSNSYTLRQRQAVGSGRVRQRLELTGGQMWSLVTETRHGLDNRTEALPMTIDPQYTVGFSWARQYGLRLVKEFRQQSVVRRVGRKSAGDDHHARQRRQFPDWFRRSRRRLVQRRRSPLVDEPVPA